MIYSRTALLQICVRSGIPKHRLHVKACNSSAETAVVLKRIQKAVRVPLPSSTTHTEVSPGKDGCQLSFSIFKHFSTAFKDMIL